MTRLRKIATLALAVTVSATAFPTAPTAQRRGGPPQPSKPTPHWPDGRVNLGPPPGETGIWTPAGIVQLSLNPKSVNRAGPTSHLPTTSRSKRCPFSPGPARSTRPARRTSRATSRTRAARRRAGHANSSRRTAWNSSTCRRPGGFYLFDVGGPHTFRTIYMDGRAHPKDLDPSYYGHSVGRWEGESLVVDTVGYNTKFWMDREGTPHTEQLHLVERFTRTDFNSLKYEVTVDDPGAYTDVWTGGFIMRWSPGTEMWEYICQDNNRRRREWSAPTRRCLASGGSSRDRVW
jgi:hypothetical protein